MDNRYQRSKIYKIISPHTDLIYIGSTIEPTLSRRLAGHTGAYKSYLVGKHNYVSSYEILQYPEYKIVLVESYPCDSKDKLLAREQHHIDLAGDNCINTQKAYTGLTEQEYNRQYCADYRVKNRAINVEYQKSYHVENRAILSAKKKQKVQCYCGSIFNKGGKAPHEKTFLHTEYLKMLA